MERQNYREIMYFRLHLRVCWTGLEKAVSETAKDRERLCELLATAVFTFYAVPGPISSSYDSGLDIGTLVNQCRNGISDGTISFAQKRELWKIFAPTCDWDDVIGDVQLGNEIFGLLDKLYGQEIRKPV
jgi:hypothetical protein